MPSLEQGMGCGWHCRKAEAVEEAGVRMPGLWPCCSIPSGSTGHGFLRVNCHTWGNDTFLISERVSLKHLIFFHQWKHAKSSSDPHFLPKAVGTIFWLVEQRSWNRWHSQHLHLAHGGSECLAERLSSLLPGEPCRCSCSGMEMAKCLFLIDSPKQFYWSVRVKKFLGRKLSLLLNIRV